MSDALVDKKMGALVGQLLDRTKTNKLEWQTTSDNNAFRAKLQNGMVRVQESTRTADDGREYVVHSLTVLDRAGRELEEYAPQYPSTDQMVQLWNLARRSALN